MARKPTLGDLFLELARPNPEGFSRAVPISEFTGRYEGLRLGNGGSWCRDNGPLGQRFNIRRNKPGGKIVSVELQGLKKVPIAKPIPAGIRRQLKGERCVVLDVGSNIEVDHRDGRLDDPRLSNPELVTVGDFQPLSKAVNNAKRQHCKECRETGLRFDAKRLGYSVGQFAGNGEYNGTCIGCYWHDPPRFNAEVSKGFSR